MLMKNTAEPQLGRTKYPIMEFTCLDQDDEIYKQKKRAYRIGEWLLVSYCGQNYKIYRPDGKPAIKAIFEDVDVAKWVAQMLQDKFGEYFHLWKEYPEMDIFSVAQWSVENGISINTVIQAAKTGKDLADGLRRTI